MTSLRAGDSVGTDTFGRVISTLPTRLTCRLVAELPDAYRARYDWGQAYGAHCLVLALEQPLTDVYWLSITEPGYPFMALVEHTNMRAPEEYGGRHIVYLGNYRPMTDDLFTADFQGIGRTLCTLPDSNQPSLRPNVGARVVGLRCAVRPADCHDRLQAPHPAV